MEAALLAAFVCDHSPLSVITGGCPSAVLTGLPLASCVSSRPSLHTSARGAPSFFVTAPSSVVWVRHSPINDGRAGNVQSLIVTNNLDGCHFAQR